MNQSIHTKRSKTKTVYTFLLLLATGVSTFTNAQSGNQIIPELIFQNPTVVAGIAGADGATYRFNNVADGIDAKVKITRRSAQNVTLTTIDLTGFGWNKAFQPRLGIVGTVAANQNWWMEFEMQFLKGGTEDKMKMKGFKVTALDVDGDNESISEYVQMQNFKTMQFSTITNLNEGPLVVVNNLLSSGDDIDNSKGITKLVQGPVKNATDIDTAATSVMAMYEYADKDKITFKLGAKSGVKISDAGERMSSLWFKAFSLAPPRVILPVRMASFSAWLDKGSVTINWATESEVAFSHFVLEKSTNGSAWKDIATIFAAGTQSTTTAYAYKDKNVTTPTGILYYRLRLVEGSKEVSYTSVKIIRLGKDESKSEVITSYPNPVQQQLRITLPDGWQNKAVQIELYNSNGVKVKESKITNASQTENILMADVAKGFYLVKVTCENRVAQQAIVKN